MSRRKIKRISTKKTAAPSSAWKLWCFRLVAIAGLPLLFLGLVELGLRVGGFGYPTAFLLKSSNHGVKTLVQNSQFGWRFFGARQARLPDAISIPSVKPPDTVRIFVFGESAAYGDPQPHFGLPRMLGAMLDMRHPGKKFEVLDAAMTAINSHVILPLARDCEEAHADAWVIYMGNNEVVGPFGAGTIFGGQATPLPLIRAGLALKSTKIGQLQQALLERAGKNSATSGGWQGMRSFIKYKLAASDPRLSAVYDNFGKNLKDIISAGQNSGAKIVLSTVGANLKDCAPFASLHRPDLAASQLEDWQSLFDSGLAAQKGGDIRQAMTAFNAAARIDDSFAELRFFRGQDALLLNDVAFAQKEFSAARDLDALRFRCDSRLNDIIRQQGTGEVALADGERALAEAAADGIPGGESFYEHVHLTFQGNYILARVIAENVEKALMLPQNAAWPDIHQCEQRLAHTPRDTQLALSDMLGRLSDVPFTYQANHGEQMRRLTAAARGLPGATSPTVLRDAQTAAENALTQSPNQADLWEQLARIKQDEGDFSGAAVAARRSLDLVPSSAQCWLLYGIALAQGEKYQDAATAFKESFTVDPQAVWARHNYAMCLEKMGRREEAVAELKHTLALKPDYGTAWLALGQLNEQMGHTNEAQQCYESALTNRVNQADDLATLARFCYSRRWFGPAVTNYAAAIELSPSDPGLRMEAGRALSAFGRHEESVKLYQSVVELAPGQAQPHLQLGIELGRLRKTAQAEQEFKQALQIDPNLIDAHANLGVALYEQEKFAEAQQQFEDVLRRNPKQGTALHYMQLMASRTPSSSGK